MRLNTINNYIRWNSESENLFELEFKFRKEQILTNFCPKFSLKFRDEFNEIFLSIEDLKCSLDYKQKEIENMFLFMSETQEELNTLNPSMGGLLSSRKMKNWHNKYEFLNEFIIKFEDNFNAYFNINNKIGFFDKFSLEIKDSNNVIISQNSYEIEKIKDDFNIENLIKLKIKKLRDNSIRLLIDKDYANFFDIKYILFTPELNANISSVKTEELKSDVYFEFNFLNNFENLNFIFLPLTQIQFEIFNFLKDKGFSLYDILNINNQYYNKYTINKNEFILQTKNESIDIIYQAPFYLYNDESYLSLSYPEEFEIINNIKYKKYFPKANKNLTNPTKLINPTYYLYANNIGGQSHLDIDLLGYKYLSNSVFIDKNINEDLNESTIFNIKNVSLINVEKSNNIYKIYLELTSNIPKDYFNKIYAEFLSSKFELLSKNIKLIDNKEYVNFLIKYEYIGNLTNEETLKSNIIEDKILTDIRFNLNL